MSGQKIGDATGTYYISGVNEKLEPFIQLRVTGKLDGIDVVLVGQQTPAELRTAALGCFHAAEAAESDSLVARFLAKDVGLTVEGAAVVVGRLRNHRTEPLFDPERITETEVPE